MKLGTLIEMYNSGALNIEFSEDMKKANIGEIAISYEQAETMCRKLGWSEWQLHPYVIIDKTRKFLKGIKNHIDGKIMLEQSEISFKNKETRNYGKTCDRIHVCNPKLPYEFSIIYNMPDTPAKYTVYKSSNSIPIAKCRTAKQVGEYLNSLEPKHNCRPSRIE